MFSMMPDLLDLHYRRYQQVELDVSKCVFQHSKIVQAMFPVVKLEARFDAGRNVRIQEIAKLCDCAQMLECLIAQAIEFINMLDFLRDQLYEGFANVFVVRVWDPFFTKACGPKMRNQAFSNMFNVVHNFRNFENRTMYRIFEPVLSWGSFNLIKVNKYMIIRKTGGGAMKSLFTLLENPIETFTFKSEDDAKEVTIDLYYNDSIGDIWIQSSRQIILKNFVFETPVLMNGTFSRAFSYKNFLNSIVKDVNARELSPDIILDKHCNFTVTVPISTGSQLENDLIVTFSHLRARIRVETMLLQYKVKEQVKTEAF